MEAVILRQAEDIKARHAAKPENRDLDSEIERARQYGTAQQVELLSALKEGRAPEFFGSPATQSGAEVPPHLVFDAATHQPIAPPPEDGEPTPPELDNPVREGDEDVAPYDQWTKADLQAEIEVRNAHGSHLTKSGTVAELADRLRSDDKAS